MRTKKLDLHCLFLVIIMHFIVSCSDDSVEECLNCKENAGVTLNISLEEVVEATNMLKAYTSGTNSPRLDYNTLNDINVVMYTNNEPYPYVYYFNSSSHPANFNLPMTGGTSSLTIYTSTSYTEIYLVANYGSAISKTSIPTVNDLKSIGITLPTSNAPDKCTMFAKAIDQGTTNANGCKVFNAALQRNLAMVTVSLHGKNLKTGVSIKPTRISIKNVPGTSTLGLDNNKITGTSNLRTGYSLMDSSWPALNNIDSVIGYDTHSTTSSLAFFAFENMQGTNSSVGNQTAKKSDPTLMPYATYITVEAQYSYGSYKGDITYRFCLGTDITSNYDVIRNSHYIVSLYLSDWGGALEGGRISNNTLAIGTGQGVNWRVIMNLYDYGFSNTDYNFDAHINSGNLPVSGSCKFFDFQYNPAINTSNVSEHWILTTKANNTWIPMETGSADAIKNNQFTYFIKPWRYTDPGFPKTKADKQYRECSITIIKSNGTSPQTVVFRQWAPIKITNTLYLERFDEGKTSGESNLRWGYLDAFTLPVGFTIWSTGGADNNKGFENTVLLNLLSPASAYCLQKGGYNITNIIPSILATQFKPAAYYLPTIAELDTITRYTFDIFDPSSTNVDLINKTVDYWSSSANNTGTYYWNKTTVASAITATRTGLKKVRAVYRPSKDTP